MRTLLLDLWLLVGRLFPLPVKPGLRKVGNPNRSSPVLVTCNFELTVRIVTKTLEHHGIDAWLLVAPTKGVNAWCAGGAGDFTADTVVSIIKTSGIEDRVDHRVLILPQLAANGINIWSVKERTGWRPRFGPADIKNFPAYLESGKARTEREDRIVEFKIKDRFVMGTNLGFNVSLLLILPLLLLSIWIPSLWWKTLPLLFVLSTLASLLVFWLPGKIGVQKGIALGVFSMAVFTWVCNIIGPVEPWSVLGWNTWILMVSAFIGYDLPSWSPLWRQDPIELILGKKSTHVEVVEDKCISCHMCDIVCPAGVFGLNNDTRKYEVVNLDACLACGACIENCPTDAIINNFREGACSCPTCYVIDKVQGKKEPASAGVTGEERS